MNATDLVTLHMASAWFPHRRGRQPSAPTITKWVEIGVKGVRLKAVRSGGEWFTCREWVEAFLRERG